MVDPYVVVILTCIFGTITRSTAGAVFGVSGISGGSTKGTGDLDVVAGFGVRDTLRGVA